MAVSGDGAVLGKGAVFRRGGLEGDLWGWMWILQGRFDVNDQTGRNGMVWHGMAWDEAESKRRT